MNFKIGDRVNVYGIMNPRRDLVKTTTIKSIGPMHTSGEDMLWFECGGGAWHPDACEKVETDSRNNQAEIPFQYRGKQ